MIRAFLFRPLFLGNPTQKVESVPPSESLVRGFFPFRRLLVCLLALLCASPSPLVAYSVLSHESIIDSAWKTDIRPLLLKRFPDASHDELRQAHACAYGGAIIQDLGYYPHGNKLFSDLTTTFAAATSSRHCCGTPTLSASTPSRWARLRTMLPTMKAIGWR